MARQVLVLDDNPGFVRAVAAAASSLGLSVIAVDHADDALPPLLSKEPAAAIIDCMIGDRSGLCVLGVIGAVSPDLPTLVVSGYGACFLAQAEEEGRSHGLTRLETLAKPFRMNALLGFLDTVRAAA